MQGLWYNIKNEFGPLFSSITDWMQCEMDLNSSLLVFRCLFCHSWTKAVSSPFNGWERGYLLFTCFLNKSWGCGEQILSQSTSLYILKQFPGHMMSLINHIFKIFLASHFSTKKAIETADFQDIVPHIIADLPPCLTVGRREF